MNSPAPTPPASGPSSGAQPAPQSGAGSVHVPGDLGRLSVRYGPGRRKPAAPVHPAKTPAARPAAHRPAPKPAPKRSR